MQEKWKEIKFFKQTSNKSFGTFSCFFYSPPSRAHTHSNLLFLFNHKIHKYQINDINYTNAAIFFFTFPLIFISSCTTTNQAKDAIESREKNGKNAKKIITFSEFNCDSAYCILSRISFTL